VRVWATHNGDEDRLIQYSGNLTQANETGKPQPVQSALSYRTLVALNSSELETMGQRFKLTPGMQVSAEINLGTRTVLQYTALADSEEPARGVAGKDNRSPCDAKVNTRQSNRMRHRRFSLHAQGYI
jgi:hypothetical protein